MQNFKTNSTKSQLSVADAVKGFYGKDTQTKSRIINRILPRPNVQKKLSQPRGRSDKSDTSKGSGDKFPTIGAKSRLYNP